jgi:hypothetical protein
VDVELDILAEIAVRIEGSRHADEIYGEGRVIVLCSQPEIPPYRVTIGGSEYDGFKISARQSLRKTLYIRHGLHKEWFIARGTKEPETDGVFVLEVSFIVDTNVRFRELLDHLSEYFLNDDSSEDFIVVNFTTMIEVGSVGRLEVNAVCRNGSLAHSRLPATTNENPSSVLCSLRLSTLHIFSILFQQEDVNGIDP